jgi:molybdopterin-biosynthesis enzyme MoeA-like protein
VIGNKILSGRTKDENIGYIAEYLTALGIDLMEVRVVGDEETARHLSDLLDHLGFCVFSGMYFRNSGRAQVFRCWGLVP